MRRVELLIETARKLSQNTRYDSTSGLPQDVFVQFLNNAQDSLTMEVENLKTRYFKKQVIVPVVANQEVYAYPDGCYMQHIETIQWTDSPSGTYWTTLYKTSTKEKITIQPGYPFAYVPYEDGFHMNPPITRGNLYVTFVRVPTKLAKRSGMVSSVTFVGGNLTALTLDASESSFDANEINSEFFLCVCDKFGAIKSEGIQYNSVDPITGVVDLIGITQAVTSFSQDDYILVGKKVVNIPEWPDICEGYLLKHMVYEAKYGDSSSWTPQALADMTAYFQKLSGSFATLSDDINAVPITNLDYIGW